MTQKHKKNDNWRFVYWFLLLLLIVATGFFSERDRFAKKETITKTAVVSEKEKKETSKESKEPTEKKAAKTSEKVNQEQIPGKAGDWQLELVNRDHPIKEEPTDIGEFQGYPVDNKIVPALTAMTAGAKKDGIDLLVVSAFRSVSYQEQLFQESVNEGLNQGLSQEEAKTEALKYRTEPGTSEHHTGLACDIVDAAWNNENGDLIDEFGEAPGGKWLAEHGPEYGFVVRYPKNKEKVTYIEYEPWHMRYVGIENAKYMQKNQLALEEYVALLKG